MKGRSTMRVTSFESEDQDLRDPKIHRVFPLGLTWAIFGPQILQKSCLPSERTVLGNFSSLLAVSYSDFEPFLKRTAPLGLCQPLWDVPSRCHATNLADSQCFKILLRISKSIPLDGRPPVSPTIRDPAWLSTRQEGLSTQTVWLWAVCSPSSSSEPDAS